MNPIQRLKNYFENWRRLVFICGMLKIKSKLESTDSEMNTELNLMVSQRESLRYKHGELSTDANTLKFQLNKLEYEF